MDSTVDSAATARGIAVASALVVDPKLNEALSIVALLTSEGFEVTVAETFAKAKERLSARPPALLVTEVRLGEYNGLHLVLRGKAQRPNMAALVMSSTPDAVLQTEAEAMGATFLVKPIDNRELLAAVTRTLFQREGPVRAPFERRSTDRRVTTLAIGPDRRVAERRRDLAARLQNLPV